MLSKRDVQVEQVGDEPFLIFWLNTDDAREWVDENVQDPQWFATGLLVEPAYVLPLVEAMSAAGLVVA